MKKLISFLILSACGIAQAEPMLITGQISSAEKQVVSAPKTDRWQIQVQWLLEEGTIAQKGDLIAVFDAGNIQSQIKQNQEALATAKLVLKQKKVELQQAVVEAQGALNVANLEVEKASIEAAVTSVEVSEYDRGQYKLTYERAVFDKIKAQQALELKQQEQVTEIEKQRIEITKIEEDLAFQKIMLERVSVKAKVAGPVSHAYHPWNGDKITAGSMVQQAMKVMSVEGQESYQVMAWVHEIDVNKIKVGDKAELTLDAFSEHQYKGTVAAVASQSEKKDDWSTSAYHLVRIEFDTDPKQTLMPGMSVRVVVDKEAL